jgi:hypothetical protein
MDEFNDSKMEVSIEEIMDLGQHDPLIDRCLYMWRSGLLDFEGAMKLAVYYLIHDRRYLSELLYQKALYEPPKSIVIKKEDFDKISDLKKEKKG